MLSTPRPCDCLDRCGDDPDMHTGRVAVCARKRQRDRELAEAAERLHLQHAIAIDAAVRCVRFGAPTEWGQGLEWFRTDAPERCAQPHADVARAARYLLLSNRALSHPTLPGLLCLVDPPQRRRTDRGAITTKGASQR